MKKAFPAFFIGLVAITLLDSLGAIASGQMSFNYSYLSLISFLIYFVIAFIIARQTDKKTTIVSTSVLGLYDATVGWKLSMILQANSGGMTVKITPVVLITTVVFMTLFAALLGLLGWGLLTKIFQKK
jgi:hypothetical protein